MARKPKQKLLTQIPTKFDPDFVERLSKRYSLTRIVKGPLAALEAHVGGEPSYVQRSLIRRTIWLELCSPRVMSRRWRRARRSTLAP